VLGVKTNFNGLIRADEKTAGIAKSQVFEMRMASTRDLMLIASDDVKMQALINRARSLATTPAFGPTVRFDMDLGALLKGMQSLTTPAGSSPGWPIDLGTLTMKAEMKNGKLTTRTSFDIAKIGRLVSVLQALAASK
jgi:hypothetical protein